MTAQKRQARPRKSLRCLNGSEPGLITCVAAKDNTHIDFGETLQVETARALIQDWAIAAIRFVLKEDTDLQSETSPIAQEVRQILTAWLPDFVVSEFYVRAL